MPVAGPLATLPKSAGLRSGFLLFIQKWVSIIAVKKHLFSVCPVSAVALSLLGLVGGCKSGENLAQAPSPVALSTPEAPPIVAATPDKATSSTPVNVPEEKDTSVSRNTANPSGAASWRGTLTATGEYKPVLEFAHAQVEAYDNSNLMLRLGKPTSPTSGYMNVILAMAPEVKKFTIGETRPASGRINQAPPGGANVTYMENNAKSIWISDGGTVTLSQYANGEVGMGGQLQVQLTNVQMVPAQMEGNGATTAFVINGTVKARGGSTGVPHR